MGGRLKGRVDFTTDGDHPSEQSSPSKKNCTNFIWVFDLPHSRVSRYGCSCRRYSLFNYEFFAFPYRSPCSNSNAHYCRFLAVSSLRVSLVKVPSMWYFESQKYQIFIFSTIDFPTAVCWILLCLPFFLRYTEVYSSAILFFCLQHLLNTISSFSQDFHRCSNTASQSASMQWKPVEIPSQTVLHKSLCHRINFLSLFFPFKDFELPLQTAFNPFPMSPSSSLNLQE